VRKRELKRREVKRKEERRGEVSIRVKLCRIYREREEVFFLL
jgi:hypothetical protein